MADAKISALSAGGALGAADELVVARSGGNDKIEGNRMPGFELDYVQRTTGLTVTATSAATAQTFIDGNAISFNGSTIVLVEFFCPLGLGNNFLSVDLWDGSTDLGVIAQVNTTGDLLPLYGAMRLTPSNASHTYHIKAWRGTTLGELDPGAGGAGTRVPGFYRVTVVA